MRNKVSWEKLFGFKLPSVKLSLGLSLFVLAVPASANPNLPFTIDFHDTPLTAQFYYQGDYYKVNYGIDFFASPLAKYIDWICERSTCALAFASQLPNFAAAITSSPGGSILLYEQASPVIGIDIPGVNQVTFTATVLYLKQDWSNFSYGGIEITSSAGNDIIVPLANGSPITVTAPPGQTLSSISIVSYGPQTISAGWFAPIILIPSITFSGVATQSKLAITLSKSSVYPNNTSGDNETFVTAHLANGDSTPISGKAIQFSAIANELSGGHNHSGGRPIGDFDSSSCTTGADGTCSVSFSASEVGGVETITGTLNGDPTVTRSSDVTVAVANLYELADNPTKYRLTGQTGTHSANHFYSGSGFNIVGVAFDFVDEYDATLGINDMSLPSGGLFDIHEDWNKPHSLHREGRSADIDQCALSNIDDNPNDQGTCPNGWVKVPRQRITEICENNNGHIIQEATIHCEF